MRSVANLSVKKNHQYFIFIFIVLLIWLNCARGQDVTPRPCDILADASPCVASISTTRALYLAYAGPLYQVTRESDNKSYDIGLLPDGYANAAAQDLFCADSRCTITRLYDQSSNHNDLTLAPGSRHARGPGPNGSDVAARAKVLPIVIHGHKAYGIAITPGAGYRNNRTSGIAVNGQSEGVYMVTSALHLNSKCCFDFGNAERDNNDNGAGHMDAINIRCAGEACNYITVNLDVEDGLFGRLPVPKETMFVTAMGANDGRSSYALYQGNSQAGALSSTGPLPLSGKYAPMRQEGAIVLGIGGDNSNFASGAFFEGVMTKGMPSIELLNAVQANIVSAKYDSQLIR